ncbi:hypothetical protein PENANT_c008G10361 [Penicillium antarcticum]|uniref:Uncharacterized protein n=1 Tax=Penicillium antarcticum TaxID=416450 RepID=A0A1V6QAU7_9EURO|nr:hypothetical protein PENANT_c008G10361 [Penicillium antarcticum]
MLVGLPWTSDNQDAEPNYTKTQGTNAPDACVLGKTEKRYAISYIYPKPKIAHRFGSYRANVTSTSRISCNAGSSPRKKQEFISTFSVQ